jgi:hypothetical protein
MTALCLCGHDYGSHDGKRCTVRLGDELTCACLGFKLATPEAKPSREVSPRDIVAGGWRAAGKGTPAPAGEATKGDSLLLLRIAVALERIADAKPTAPIGLLADADWLCSLLEHGAGLTNHAENVRDAVKSLRASIKLHAGEPEREKGGRHA